MDEVERNDEGGAVGTAQFPALAQYFVKFLQAYQAQQIPIYAVSMQNEPLYSTAAYPSATVAPADQALFIGHHLGPALAAAGFGTTKILAYDHNWDHPEYPQTVLSDAQPDSTSRARPSTATAAMCRRSRR